MNELFGDNRTKLAAVAEAESVIPIMPGVSAATGLYEAMLDNMKSDLAIYEAMMSMDALELKMRREGSLTEGAMETLKKGAGKLVKVVIEGLKKLASWIKSVAATFTLAILKKLDSDKLLISKYGAQVKKSDKVGDITITYRKQRRAEDSLGTKAAIRLSANGFNKSLFDRMSNVTDDYEKVFWDQVGEEAFMRPILDGGVDAFFDGPAKEVKFKEIGADFIIGCLTDLKKRIADFSKTADTVSRNVDKASREVEQYLNRFKTTSDVTDSNGKKIGSTTSTEEPNKVNFVSKAFTLYKTTITSIIKATQDYLTYDYKQNKAAFMKAVAVVSGVKNEAAVESFIEEEMNDIDAVLADTTSDEVIEILNKQTSMDTEMDDDEIGVEAPKQEEEGESAPAEETQEPFSAEEAAFFEAPLF